VHAFLTRTAPERLTVHLSGDVDMACAGYLAELGLQLRTDLTRPCEVAVDLADVTFLDSTGLSFVASLYRHQRRCGGSVLLVAPQRSVRRVLEVTGMASLLAPEATGPAAPPPAVPGPRTGGAPA
jgi:anti-sigma B factor antagonist